MKKMTFDDYDAMCDRFADMPYQCDNWWPSPEELDQKINGEINQYIDFLVWILETNEAPETEEEKRSEKYINKLLRENLKLIDHSEKK